MHRKPSQGKKKKGGDWVSVLLGMGIKAKILKDWLKVCERSN